MEKFLILPDIHGRQFWREAIENINLEDIKEIIFLGDYLDPYPQENIDFGDAIFNFLEIIKFAKENKNKVTLLLGNHDLHYYQIGWRGTGSRFNMWKSNSIHKLFMENKDLFKLAHLIKLPESYILFTHAGINDNWLKGNDIDIKEINTEDLEKWLCGLGLDLYGQVGWCRGGLDEGGSPVWSDYNREMSMNSDYIKDNLYQIVGHTQLQMPIIKKYSACLDCHRPFILTESGILGEVECEEGNKIWKNIIEGKGLDNWR